MYTPKELNQLQIDRNKELSQKQTIAQAKERQG